MLTKQLRYDRDEQNKQEHQKNIEKFVCSKTDLKSRTDLMKKFVYSPIRIRLKDDRIMIGRFICVDGNKNFIIGEAREFYPKKREDLTKENGSREEVMRVIGMSMIRGEDIKGVWISVLKQNEGEKGNKSISNENPKEKK